MNKTGFNIFALVIAFATLMASPAEAQQSVRAGLEKCAAITNAAERLFCFDSLAASKETQASTESGTVSNTSRGSSAAQPPVAASRPPMQPAKEPARDNSDFGRELEQARDGPQSISSRYDGGFTGWSGDTEFQLENGQVWKQVESGRLVLSSERPVVTIRRGWFGAFYLKVEGANKQIRVKRIK